MNYVVIIIGYTLFIIADHVSNVGLYVPLLGTVMGYAVGDGIICLLFVLSRMNRKKYSFTKQCYILTMIIIVTGVDMLSSVFNVIDRGNQVKEYRQLSDPILNEWKTEVNNLIALDQRSRCRYDSLIAIGLTKGAEAERIENAVKTIPRIQHLNTMIAEKESVLSSAGGRLNEAILQIIPNQLYATIFLAFLGIIPPIGMQILGERWTELREEKKNKIGYISIFERLIQRLFNTYSTPVQHLFNIRSTPTVEQFNGTSTDFPVALVTIVTIGYLIEKYPHENYSTLIQRFIQLLNRRGIDKSMFSKVNNIDKNPNMKEILNADPALTKKVYSWISWKDQNKNKEISSYQ